MPLPLPRRIAVAALFCVCLLAQPVPLRAEEQAAESPDFSPAADLLFVRPLGLVFTAVSPLCVAVSLPVALVGGGVLGGLGRTPLTWDDDNWARRIPVGMGWGVVRAVETLTVCPAEQTFLRPLGYERECNGIAWGRGD